MSVLCTVTSASSEQLQELLANPSYTSRFLLGPPPPTFRSRLRSLLGRPVTPEPAWLTVPPPKHYELEKAWDGVRFLLTGVTDPSAASFPEAFLGAGGQPVGTEDFGYGPARAFSPSQVLDINECLASQSIDSLEARFDPVHFSSQHIYPSTIWHREREHTIGWLLAHFVGLRNFITAAANRGGGILVHFA